MPEHDAARALHGAAGEEIFDVHEGAEPPPGAEASDLVIQATHLPERWSVAGTPGLELFE